MDIQRVDGTEYAKYVIEYTTVFESPEFNTLNAGKCSELLYLLFVNSKYRFGLIAGLTADKVMKIPFSAPYSMFTAIKQNNKVMDYHDAVKALIKYAEASGLKEIRFTLPPKFYNETHISNIENALYANDFYIIKADLNFQYDLNLFDKNYIQNLDIKARQKLNASVKSGLRIVRATAPNDIMTAYDVIRQNRQEKGYPLHMTYDDVESTAKIINADFFIIKDPNENAVASAMIFHVSKDIAQVIYWGSLKKYDDLRPMNFLSYQLFQYYHDKGLKYLDIGPSTDDSMPNFGLCDFKQSIGCGTNTKYTFSYRTDGYDKIS